MGDLGRELFRKALSDFAFEAACGAAIRHMADSGCTARQIMDRLDYPISGEQVRKALYKHLCDTGVILEKSPEEGLPESKEEYILEYNSYGRPSYRRKNAARTGGGPFGSVPDGAEWKEAVYPPEKGLAGSEDAVEKASELSAFLTGRCNLNKGETAYVSCDFGIPGSPAAKGISLLNGRQQEYLEGIPWPCHRVYHRLDSRMKEMICRLYGQNAYEGICFFPAQREKLYIAGSDTGICASPGRQQQKGDSK